ncbi:TetR/AcrR family transcriptional regulator [Actinokineospora inagensis]|uniref:TetR/AcrR family transcriptional regulator n=1 Tax=Actinokineospora inagensis TaxID=103730 RepID=UPI00041DE15A|nr:TetR/AcrR family transcriptional regulator [Actinokineospora inagensis]
MRQDARENRDRILAAAEAVFGDLGAAGSTEEVARLAGVGIATVFRHFPTKDALVSAALVRHFEHLLTRADALAAHPDQTTAWSILLREMIETGATKLTLLPDDANLRDPVLAVSGRLKTAVSAVLRRAQEAGAVRARVTVEEVYLLIRALSQATATMRPDPPVLDNAIKVIIAGLATAKD